MSDLPSAALTQEQRDVLIVWEWIKARNGRIAPHEIYLILPGFELMGFEDMGSAANWIRKQLFHNDELEMSE